MTVDSDGHAIAIDGLREKSLWMKLRVGILKLLKPIFLNQTTTVRFVWERGSDLKLRDKILQMKPGVKMMKHLKPEFSK